MTGPLAIELPPITLPGVLLGLAAMAVGIVAALCARWLVRRLMLWRGRGPSSATVYGRLAGWLFVFLGVAAALTITFPSVRPVNILGGVGIISIAAGIAFQTVLGNMFAGLVILGRDKFRVGDQIEVTADERVRGTITELALTTTTVRTFDGRLVLLPNALLHSKAVTVQTGYEKIRSAVTIGIETNADVEQARQVALDAITALPQIHLEPAPQALLTEVGSGSITMELRFYSGSTQLETLEARHAVISAVVPALHGAQIGLSDGSSEVEPGPWLRSWLAGRAQPSRPSSDGHLGSEEPGGPAGL